MPVVLGNFATTTLASGITASDVTLTLVSGSAFPALAEGEYYYCVLRNDAGDKEIIKVETRDGDDLEDITRGAEGTTALAWNAGDSISVRLTAQTFEDLRDDLEASVAAAAAQAAADAIAAAIAGVDAVTVGTIIPWPTSSCPTGYLEIDGSSLSAAAYPELFAELGYIYGGSDDNFNIPDGRAETFRGWSHGSGNDPDAASRTDRGDGVTGDNVGTKQACQLGSHRHSITGYNTGKAGGGESVMDPGTAGNFYTNYTGGNETRGMNMAVMWIIKY